MNPTIENSCERQPVLFWRQAALALLVWLVFACPALGQLEGVSPVFTNAMDVFRLRPEQASNGYPVRLEAVVTYSDQFNRVAFVQDESGGVFLLCGNVVPPATGQKVVVEAYTLQGMYGSALRDPTFEVLGPAPFPEPLRPTFDELTAGRADSRWTEIEGTVRAATTNDLFLVLTLEVDGRRLRVICLDRSRPDSAHWVDARVRVRGVAGGLFNARDQFIAAQLCVSSLEQISILSPPASDPYALPITPVITLGRHVSETIPGERIHIRGTVTLFLPGRALFVRDTDRSIEVRTSQTTPVEPGDMVDVIGFYERDDYSLIIEDGSFRRIGKGEPVAPLLTTAEDLNTGRFDSILVTIEARLLEWQHRAAERTLFLQSGDVAFVARLEGTNGFAEVPPGSLVQVTGVCRVQANEDQFIQSFELLLRTPDDIVLLRQPSWWTAQHALWLLGGVGTVLVVALGWVGALRNRVRRQTRALQQKIADLERADAAVRESQALYHSLVDQLPTGIFRKDAAGRFVFVNSWFCRLKRMSADQILGRTAMELADAESQNPQATWRREFAAQGTHHHGLIMQTGKQVELEEEYTGADGETQHMHVVKSAVFGRDGSVIGTQGAIFDVTQRKRIESALAETSALMEALLENSPDLIYFKDRESRFVRYSESFLGRFAIEDASWLKNKTDRDIFAEVYARQTRDDEQQIIRTGQPIIGKTEKEVWDDGRVTWVLTSKMPWRDAEGNVIGTFGISKDMTAIKEAEAKLEEAHKRLLDTSRQAGMAEVATSVLHNVGNVLNSVNVSTSLVVDAIKHSKLGDLGRVSSILREHQSDLAGFLADDPKGRQLPEYLALLAAHLSKEQATLLSEMEETRKNVEHITDIVMMQQSFAKVSGVTEKIKVADMIEEALRINAASLARHEVEIVRDYENPELELTVDRHKVLQILVNLIRNANQSCDESGRDDKRLTVQVGNGNGRVRISVSDNGVGIAPENMTRIFQHGFTTRRHGHGFGLHSGALTARELGGALTVHSAGLGQGASFHLELPLEPPQTA